MVNFYHRFIPHAAQLRLWRVKLPGTQWFGLRKGIRRLWRPRQPWLMRRCWRTPHPMFQFPSQLTLLTMQLGRCMSSGSMGPGSRSLFSADSCAPVSGSTIPSIRSCLAFTCCRADVSQLTWTTSQWLSPWLKWQSRGLLTSSASFPSYQSSAQIYMWKASTTQWLIASPERLLEPSIWVWTMIAWQQIKCFWSRHPGAEDSWDRTEVGGCCFWYCGHYTRFGSNMNVGACGHLDDTTGAVWRHVVFFFFSFFTFEDSSLISLIVLESAATWLLHCLPLKLQKCFVDLNTHPSFGIGVNYHFFGELFL